MVNTTFTGCLDKNGKEIHFGSAVMVEFSEQNPIFSIAKPIRQIFRTAQKRTDGRPGFEIPFRKGRLYWDVDGTPCYEVSAL